MILNKIKPSELEPGDVILCRGKDMISDIISKMDGSPYSHATQYIGDYKICEADFDGILDVSLNKIKNEEKYGDVYRFNKSGHKFNNSDWKVEPVLEVGEKYVTDGTTYAFSHLILLSLIVLTRRIPLPKIEAKIIRGLVDEATQLIFNLIDNGKTPMVCSELVYRCFSEALPQDKYILDIIYPNFDETNLTLSDTPIDAELEESLNKFNKVFEECKKKNIKLMGNCKIEASCISPRDLANSPDLELIGRLSFE